MVERSSRALYADFEYSIDQKIKLAIVSFGAATGILTLTAAVTAILVSPANWPVALFLLSVGFVVLLLAWFVGIHRFQEMVVRFSSRGR